MNRSGSVLSSFDRIRVSTSSRIPWDSSQLPLLLSKSYPSLLHGVINLFCRKNDEKLIEFAKLNEAVRIFSFRTEKIREEEYFYSSKKAEVTVRENS